jgi:hypothetical protein
MADFERSLVTLVPAFSDLRSPPRITLFAMRFSRLNPQIAIPRKPRNPRFEVARQTYNPEISHLAQIFINGR